MFIKKTILLTISIILFVSCTTELKQNNIISVSVLPQKYFVERIVGDKFEVNVIIPPGSSPATYEPTPSDLIALSHSPLYFRIGHIGFEKAWMNKIITVNPKMKVVDTSENVELIMTDHHHEGEHMDEDKDEDIEGINPHIWLSPSAVKIQAENIYNAILKYDPINTEYYKDNFESFAKDIEKIDMQITMILKNIKNRKFIVYHPAWSYFAKQYNLIQMPIEFEGKSPTPSVLKNIIDTANKENVRVMIVQKQFDKKQAEAIAESMQGKVIQLDPLAENWIVNMIKIARTFQFELK
ncbi:MAG: zinc ABC transporter substrate-binding protein [Candidatus Delongbacteria bacterium]|jgi:zinc transport system substrate-binding protein|nr:zinc ABC transporter substrate-binding protein [Candidatus Delongbacteria bacterium]